MSKRRALAAAWSAAVAVTLLTGCSGASPSGTSDPSASPTVEASVSAGVPVPEPPVEGALPVPAFPASAIPWRDLGPGWFLLAYTQDVPDATGLCDPAGETGAECHEPPLDDTLMLASPAGDLFYVRSLDGAGQGVVQGWSGKAVDVLDARHWDGSGETPHGLMTSIDLASGAATPLSPDVSMFVSTLGTLADGRIAVLGAGEGYTWIDVLAPDFADSQTVCSAPENAISTISPGGAVVCLDVDHPRSAVVVHDVATGTATEIDHLKLSPEEYSIHGWWDNTSFVLSRGDGSGGTLWWAYDTSTRTVRDLNALMSDGTPAEHAQGIAGYRLVAAGSTVEVQDFSGALNAALPCRPRAVSGDTVFTLCGNRGERVQLSVTSLTDGETRTIAAFDSGPNFSLLSFPWPQGAFESLYTAQYGWGFMEIW
jgi:hypothetical protein